VPGVVEVNTFGGELQTYEVAPDPNVLRAHGLSLGDLFEALEQNNRNVGGAYLVRNREQVVIRGEGVLAGLADIESVVLRSGTEGTPLFVRDVAAVHLAPMVRQGVVTRDGGGEAVVGVVMMLMGENPREVVQRVEERLENIRGSLPDGVTIDTFYDRTELVDRTIHTVERNLLEGGLLVVAVLLLMLGNLRGGLLVALAIPLSMLFAFIGMVQAGVSGNLMSLGAIDFGLIVDGAVVMVENVYRRMHDPASQGRSRVQVVLDACREVARPVAFAVGIIMIVYLPILTLTGVEGKMFRPMALTVLFALGGSLVLAFTVIPVLGSFVLVRPKHHETWLVARFRGAYEPLLDRAMNRRGVVVAAAVGLLVASGLVASTMGTEFIPQLDEGSVALEVRRLPSVSIDEAAQQTLLLERVLMGAFPDEIRTIVSKTGRPEIATDPMGVEMSDVFVLLKPTDAWRFHHKTELVEAMEEEVAEKVPGLAVGFSQPIQLRVSELIAGVRSDVAIKVFGEDLDVLLGVGEQVARVVTAIDGAEDVKVEQVSGLPVLTARIDRTAIAQYGVRGEDIFDAIEALGGRRVGLIYEGEKRFDLQVRLPPEVRNDEDAIAALPIATSAGQLVPLGELTDIDTTEAAAQISRERTQRRIGVEVNVRGRDIGSFVEEARLQIHDKVDLPAGYTIEWGGQFENLERAAARLTVVVPLALLLIVVLLYGAFDSARPAALIFLNVPFAATGGVLALALRGMPLSISAGVGFIALFGVAVMNGVVLVSFVRELEKQGRAPREAASEGARARLRPVLMTALVAAIGFLPMALGHGAGAEVQRPLATVVIGGLVTSTLLTLFVLPSIYEWFAERPMARPEPTGAETAVVPIARS
jgi:cobalt-zinc-cadmium resistance protein CzcA